MTVRNLQNDGESLLRNSLYIVTTIIAANFLIGIFAPVLDGLDDEIQIFDNVWRVVVGQKVGVDYHNPMGFGPYQLGALLWHWFGPHYYVMRLSIAIFSLSIGFCGCIVAKRTLARRPDLALLFCVVLAFQLSTPTIYESTKTSLSMSGYYDRHIVSALAVLFLQIFGGRSTFSKRENAIEIAVAACLLNIMFLVKISGFFLGLIILLAGCLLRGRSGYRILSLCGAMVAFGVITAIEFQASGLEFIPVIQDYELAAHARLAYSLHDILRVLMSVPLAGSVALLVFFAMSQSQHSKERECDRRQLSLIIGSYFACQFAVNMTNSWGSSMWLAPAAAASLAMCLGLTSDSRPIAGVQKWWQRVSPSQFAETSIREAIPVLVFVLVLIPQIIGSIVGVGIGIFVSLGIENPPVVVTAGKGVSFKSLPWPGHDLTVYPNMLNAAVAAISALKLDRETIASLDFANPFPVLFFAPPPKGIHAWLDFGITVPRGARLEWKEVIGDACVVAVPADLANSDSADSIIDIVRPKLIADFGLVYENEYWKIYHKVRNCAIGQRP